MFFTRYFLLFLIDHINSTQRKQQALPSKTKKYTQQDVAAVGKILARKNDDFYGILGVSRAATAADIDRAYKRLSIQVHPDKNNAPGSNIAAQRLNQARTELLKRLERTSTSIFFSSTTLLNNKNYYQPQVEDEDFQVTLSSTSTRSHKKSKKTFDIWHFIRSNYVIIVGVILFIVSLILIIYNKQQQPIHRLSDASNLVEDE